MTVTIDGDTPYTTYYMDTPESYIQWYQSPTLTEGPHILKADGIWGTGIDYATVTVGQQTPLAGKNIIVDNDDPSVHYSGSWTRNTNRFLATVSGLPFRNSTHRSNTPGDTITFRFTGHSLIPSNIVFCVLTSHYTRHVRKGIWNIRMGKHWYSRCDIRT